MSLKSATKSVLAPSLTAAMSAVNSRWLVVSSDMVLPFGGEGRGAVGAAQGLGQLDGQSLPTAVVTGERGPW